MIVVLSLTIMCLTIFVIILSRNLVSLKRSVGGMSDYNFKTANVIYQGMQTDQKELMEKIDLLLKEVLEIKSVRTNRAQGDTKPKVVAVAANRKPRSEEQRRIAAEKKKKWWDEKRRREGVVTLPDDQDQSIPQPHQEFANV